MVNKGMMSIQVGNFIDKYFLKTNRDLTSEFTSGK